MEDGSIHEFDFTLINEFFTGLERQGPGSAEETIKALGFIGPLSSKAKIADLGCGTGFQTMERFSYLTIRLSKAINIVASTLRAYYMWGVIF